MGGRVGKSLDSFSSCLDWAGLWAQSVVWSPVTAAVVMIHPSGFLGKENELGKCFLVGFFFSGCVFPETVTTLHPLELTGGEGVLRITFHWLQQRQKC